MDDKEMNIGQFYSRSIMAEWWNKRNDGLLYCRHDLQGYTGECQQCKHPNGLKDLTANSTYFQCTCGKCDMEDIT